MLLTVSAVLIWAAALFAATPLVPVPTRDQKIVRRWSLPGTPHGVALGRDGVIYVGLAEPQAVRAIDAKTGAVLKELVLDSADIASTKELVTLRTNAEQTRLYIANGSDESATILSLPDLAVVREITIEGEEIRDALPDPKGRYLYVLGRRVHVYDADGKTELRALPFEDPMAIAASANGSALAVIGTNDFGNAKATAVALYDTTNFTELTRDPLQTQATIESALFAANDRALIAISRDTLFEKPVVSKPAKAMTSGTNGQMRISVDFGDLVNSQKICLPAGSGPQIATLAAASDLLLFVEQRCSASTAFTGADRRVTPASLFGVNAYAVTYDKAANTMIATDSAGFLTIYKVPRAPVVK